MTENRGGGNGPAAEQGDTERDDSRVAVVLDPIDGDLGEAKEKFSSNMVVKKLCGVKQCWFAEAVKVVEISNA